MTLIAGKSIDYRARALSQAIDDTIEDIDVLLGSGINLDQVALWEFEKLHLVNESPECARVLRKMTGCVIENARRSKKLKSYSAPSAETAEITESQQR